MRGSAPADALTRLGGALVAFVVAALTTPAVGLVGGIYGIGGGAVIAPALVAAGHRIARAAPAALAVTLVTSIAGIAAFQAIAWLDADPDDRSARTGRSASRWAPAAAGWRARRAAGAAAARAPAAPRARAGGGGGGSAVPRSGRAGLGPLVERPLDGREAPQGVLGDPLRRMQLGGAQDHAPAGRRRRRLDAGHPGGEGAGPREGRARDAVVHPQLREGRRDPAAPGAGARAGRAAAGQARLEGGGAAHRGLRDALVHDQLAGRERDRADARPGVPARRQRRLGAAGRAAGVPTVAPSPSRRTVSRIDRDARLPRSSVASMRTGVPAGGQVVRVDSAIQILRKPDNIGWEM